MDSISFEKEMPYGTPDYEIYTDGSPFKEQTGSGYIVYQGEASTDDKLVAEKYYLGAYANVFQGDIYAIKAAAE